MTYSMTYWNMLYCPFSIVEILLDPFNAALGDLFSCLNLDFITSLYTISIVIKLIASSLF